MEERFLIVQHLFFSFFFKQHTSGAKSKLNGRISDQTPWNNPRRMRSLGNMLTARPVIVGLSTGKYNSNANVTQ